MILNVNVLALSTELSKFPKFLKFANLDTSVKLKF